MYMNTINIVNVCMYTKRDRIVVSLNKCLMKLLYTYVTGKRMYTWVNQVRIHRHVCVCHSVY